MSLFVCTMTDTIHNHQLQPKKYRKKYTTVQTQRHIPKMATCYKDHSIKATEINTSPDQYISI